MTCSRTLGSSKSCSSLTTGLHLFTGDLFKLPSFPRCHCMKTSWRVWVQGCLGQCPWRNCGYMTTSSAVWRMTPSEILLSCICCAESQPDQLRFCRDLQRVGEGGEISLHTNLLTTLQAGTFQGLPAWSTFPWSITSSAHSLWVFCRREPSWTDRPAKQFLQQHATGKSGCPHCDKWSTPTAESLEVWQRYPAS